MIKTPKARRKIGESLKKTGLSHQAKAAYKFIQVDPKAILAVPQCTPTIEEMGKITALEAIRSSDHPDARKFLRVYDNPDLPDDYRCRVPLEAFCVAADICPSRLVEIAAGYMAKKKLLVGSSIASEAHPEIMRVNIEMAKTPEGVADRMAHLKMVGAMPLPKSSQTVVNVNASAQAATVASSSQVVSAEETIRTMVEARQKAAAALPAPIIEAEYENDTEDD